MLSNYDSEKYTRHGEIHIVYSDGGKQTFTLFECLNQDSCGIGHWFYWSNRMNVTEVSAFSDKMKLFTETYYRSRSLAEEGAKAWALKHNIRGIDGLGVFSEPDTQYGNNNPKYTPILHISMPDVKDDMVVWYSDPAHPNHDTGTNYTHVLKLLSQGAYSFGKPSINLFDNEDEMKNLITKHYRNRTTHSIDEYRYNQLLKGETTTMSRSRTPQPIVTPEMTLNAFKALLTRGPVFFDEETNSRDDEHAAAFVELQNTGLCNQRDGWYFINNDGMMYACRTGVISLADSSIFEQPAAPVATA